jgi:glycosyltransferase involved in cell wall biosynthesis
MTPLNVAIFTDNDFEKINGVTTALRAVLAHAPGDIRTRIYTCDSTGANRPEYLAVKALDVAIPFYSEMRMYVPPFRRFLRQAQQDRIDLIHFTTPGPVGLAAMYVARRLSLPMLGSFHTHLAEYTRLLSGSAWLGALMREYMRWPYGRCAQILAPSEATRQILREGKINPDKIAIWRRGVSSTQFDPGKRSDRLRQEWGVSDQRPAILYVGRLSREKGLAIVPSLQADLERAAMTHRFVFVGDGPMRAELETICPDAVFTGSLSCDEVAVAMASADVFVFPSRTDTAGNVVLEAQASGLPVLVSDEGGPCENIQPGQSGEVCTTIADFSAHLAALLNDPARRRRLSYGARGYAVRRNWTHSLQPLYRAYREVYAAHRSSVNCPAIGRVIGRRLAE